MPGDARQRETADLSLHAARLLRDRAVRAGDRAGRHGRPRQRFLAEQRARLGAWLVPVLAAIAALTLVAAIAWLVDPDARPVAPAVGAALAATAIVAGGGAIAARFLRNGTRALVGVAVVASSTTLLGWAIASNFAGRGAATPGYVVVMIVACVAVVPVPRRAAVAIALAGVLALLVATAWEGVPRLDFVTVTGVLVAVGCVAVAQARQRQILQAFLRTERLAAAVKRMRRVQQQLVVVEKLEALRVLVGGVAHELNNALAISVASTQQAQRDVPEGSTAAAALKRGAGGLTRIKATVDRLRRFAMAAEGGAEAADVSAMLDFALESAIGRARSGVVVERVYERDCGDVEVDVANLAEALYQVARNAVEAMPGGGTIQARVYRSGQGVVLAVKDEGKGIPEAQLGHVFDPYFRLSREGNKSGLGLSTVYGLVSAIGGSVKVESAEGRGTTVAITVPSKAGGEK